MTLHRRKIIEALFFLLLVVVAIFKWAGDYDTNTGITRSPAFAIGEIVDYYIVGEASDYLEYKYTVNGKPYSNKVIPDHIFKKCEETKDCIGRKFRVKYNKNDPSQSVILLDEELK